MLPVPLVPKPTLAELLQLNVVPATAPVKLIATAFSPLQCVRFVTLFTVGVGFTVMVNEFGAPSQVFPAFVKCGVTVILAVTGAVPLLTAVKGGILPLPLAGRPMPGVSFAHVNDVAFPVKFTGADIAPLQMV